MSTPVYTACGAAIDLTGSYRWRLWRQWGEGDGAVAFVMLNPSTADGTRDDPTIRRCVAFARAWGYARLEVVNLFAWRATDPRELGAVADPVGPENDRIMREVLSNVSLIVAAWGAGGRAPGRGRWAARDALRLRPNEVLRLITEDLLRDCHALRLTTAGYPSHPLYLPRAASPFHWRSRCCGGPWCGRCVKCFSEGCVKCLSSLPAGKTCNDCAHADRCKALFGVKGPETSCAFIPSRWRERTAVPAEVLHG